MNELLKLPFEIQIVLVAGYLGYKLTTAARKVEHKTEDCLLQVLVFGTLGRALSFVVTKLLVKLGYSAPTAVVDTDYRSVLIIGAIAIAGSILFALAWRRFLDRAVKRLMSALNVYHDDHETSALRSLTSANARWSFIQIHLTSGKILESLFHRAEASGIPTKPLIINEDGIALYVTAVHRAEGEREEFDTIASSGENIVTYVPRSEIKQIDIGWKK
ncbi:hypothetical protein [Rhizobium herbae]